MAYYREGTAQKGFGKQRKKHIRRKRPENSAHATESARKHGEGLVKRVHFCLLVATWLIVQFHLAQAKSKYLFH